MSGSPSRQSKRVTAKEKKVIDERKAQGLPEDGSYDFRLEVEMIRGIRTQRKRLIRTKDNVSLGVWACNQAWDLKKFYPGQIIRAIRPYSESNIDVKFNELGGNNGMTSDGGVGAKNRYMIVLWKTNYGLYCIPMFTFSGVISVNHLDKDRVGELVTMVTEDKRDKIIDHTAWAGLPLIMNLNPSMLGAAPSQIAYADLSRPYWVGKTEQITDKVGSLDGDEYLRLVCLFEQKQKTWIENSFKEFGVDYINVPSITPTPPSDGRTDGNFGPNVMVMADNVFNGQYNSKFKAQRIKKKHDEAAKNRGVVKK